MLLEDMEEEHAFLDAGSSLGLSRPQSNLAIAKL